MVKWNNLNTGRIGKFTWYTKEEMYYKLEYEPTLTTDSTGAPKIASIYDLNIASRFVAATGGIF